MQTTSYRALLIALALITSAVPALARDPVDVRAAGNVDEALFLVRVLENLYDQISLDASFDEPDAHVTSLRRQALRHHEHLKQRKPDETLTALYGDLVATIDAYEDALVKLGRIEAASAAEREQRHQGVLGDLALQVVTQRWLRALHTVASAAADDDEAAMAQRVREDNARRTFQRTLSGSLARAETTVLALADTHGWRRGEAGFDMPVHEKQRLRLLTSATTRPASRPATGPALPTPHQVLASNLAPIVRRRPRDPFLSAQRAYVLGSDPSAGQADVLARAREIIAAASLVPPGAVYDDYRAGILQAAAQLATAAAYRESEGKGFAWGRSEAAALAGSAWDAAVDYGARDPSGALRQEQATMHALCGERDLALEEYLSLVDLRKDDASYAYNYACLLSAAGRTEEALHWLREAVRIAPVVVRAQAPTDPDMQPLRTRHRQEFERIVAAVRGGRAAGATRRTR